MDEEKVTLATTAMNVVFDKRRNLAKYLKFVDEAAEKGAKLIVFPEQSLQGYLESLTELKSSSVEYQHANAEPVPDGPSVQELVGKAREKEMYIIWGMTEAASDEGPTVLYNTAVLTGPDGYVGKYRKVHQPLDELHVFFRGKSFNVFDTEVGKIGMLICYDKTFPESCRELALQGAELLVMPTAWPLSKPGGDPNPDEDHKTYLYDLYDKVRAAENQCFFISSNQIGKTGDHDYLGHSRIVAPNGIVLAELGYQEGMVTATVDIRGDMLRARTTDMDVFMLKDRHPEVYTHLGLRQNLI